MKIASSFPGIVTSFASRQAGAQLDAPNWVTQTRRPRHNLEAARAAFWRHLTAVHHGQPSGGCPACADFTRRHPSLDNPKGSHAA